MSKQVKLILALALPAVFALGVMAWVKYGRSKWAEGYTRRPPGAVTFNKEIAPIVFNHCAGCHRPGQPAPFSLLTYGDVKKRAKQIADATTRRIMPPWLPEPGHGEFVGERRLSAEQIGLIQQWEAEGAAEGNPSDLPLVPAWSDEWRFAKPDLVVTMPQAYTLPVEGKDVYRNFVIQIPIAKTHYVQAVEFRPGNTRIVHHAFLRIDPTKESRQLDDRDPEPGFGGIHVPRGAQSPDGHFLSWQPGKVPNKGVEGLSWVLEPGTDLVLQMHMQPSGKPEVIQSSIGIYFTDKPPSLLPFKIRLISFDIDIPAGQKDYVVRDSFVLPVDAEVIGVLPHAHDLGKDLRTFATLPDGTKKWLLRIKEWDFNWQGDYRYVRPVFLPKGTTLSMEFSYDNSSDNPRNPHQPPQRVQYGLQSTDEMAELWFQVLLRDRKDLESMARGYQPKVAKDVMAYNLFLLRSNPNDARVRTELGKALLAMNKDAEATTHLRAAVQADPQYDEPRYYLGLLFRTQRNFAQAKAEFEAAIRLNPDNFKAHGNLGLIYLEQGNLEQGEAHLRSALRINPNDVVAKESLDELSNAKAARKR